MLFAAIASPTGAQHACSFHQSSLIPLHAAYQTFQSMGSFGTHSAVMPTATRFRVHPVVANPTPPLLYFPPLLLPPLCSSLTGLPALPSSLSLSC